MKLEEALKHLGATRVIWIDDHFTESPERLGEMLIQNLEAALKCKFPELNDILERYEYEEEGILPAVIEALQRLTHDRRDRIRDDLLASERRVEGAPIREMKVDAIRTACELLAVAPVDRWTFEKVEAKVKEAIQAYADENEKDASVSYVVDIKDDASDGAGNRRGLDVLRMLANEGSRSTAFVLTHETTTLNEETYERQLVGDLDTNGIAPFPFCVVSKERLFGEAPGNGDMEEAFRVAIKRAGLRRSVHEVLDFALPVIDESFREAKRKLLRIPPEVLDKHVVDRGYEEGESELHVIERALTAHIARDVRKLFGTDARVKTSNERVRSLRDIKLKSGADRRNEDLIDFRNAETWEDDALINSAFSPLACGDVFQIDDFEPKAKSGKGRLYLLLGQPCDIQLRNKGDRVARTGILAPVRYRKEDAAGQAVSADKLKECVLQCSLQGRTVICDLRNAATVNLSILDLATFRSDGRVRYDRGQVVPPALLPGQGLVFGDRTSWLEEVIADFEAPGTSVSPTGAGVDAPNEDIDRGVAPTDISAAAATSTTGGVIVATASGGVTDVQAKRDAKKAAVAATKAAAKAKAEGERLAEAAKVEAHRKAGIQRRLQLVFSPSEDFKHVEVGMPEAALNRRENKLDTGLPPRVTWSLHRIGRIRMPYASDVLDRYVGMISRSAFDIEFAEHEAISDRGGDDMSSAVKEGDKTVYAEVNPSVERVGEAVIGHRKE